MSNVFAISVPFLALLCCGYEIPRASNYCSLGYPLNVDLAIERSDKLLNLDISAGVVKL